MKAKLKNYMYMDFRRAFGNWRIPVGILGVFVAFLYNGYEISDAVAWVSDMILGTTLIMVAFMFSIYPYATAFCEDMEYHSDIQFRLRGSSFSYACSKLIVVFFSSVFTMLSGFLLTIFVVYLKKGLPSQEIVKHFVECQGHYYQLVEQGHYMLYFLCAGLQIGCLAGVLAVLGLVCSLFIRNRMMVCILPVSLCAGKWEGGDKNGRREWGRIIYTMTYSQSMIEYNVFGWLSSVIYAKYTPVQAMLLCFFMVGLITSLMGLLMFAISLYANRMLAVSIAAVLTGMNLSGFKFITAPWLPYVIPFYWCRISIYEQPISHLRNHPSLMFYIVLSCIVIGVAVGFILLRARRVEYIWNKEE